MHENYIRDCIEGILMQRTTFPVCVALHDDASTDGTAEIIREYESRFPRLIKAYYQSRNTYSLSKEEKSELRKPFFDLIVGKYCAICEGDDYWTDEFKLQKQVDILESRNDCSLVCHAVNYIDYSTKKVMRTHRTANKSRDIEISELIAGGGFIATLSIVHCLDYLLEKPEFYRVSPAGDYPLVLLSATKGKIHYVDEVMGCYRCNVPGSAMYKVRTTTFENQVSRYEQFAKMLYAFDEYTCGEYNKEIRKKASSMIAANFVRASKGVSFLRKFQRMRKIPYPLKMIDYMLIFISFIPFGTQLLEFLNTTVKKIKNKF